MVKFLNRRGVAIPEYVLVAALFAVTLGLAIFELSPDLLRNYFENSIDNHATVNENGNLTIKVMGE